MKPLLLYMLFIFCLGSCSQRNLTYLSDLDEKGMHHSEIINGSNPRIQPDDLLTITISSLNPESNVLFNKGVLLTSTGAGGGVAAGKLNEGYMVDKYGYVVFPIIGRVKLAGLTKEEAARELTGILSEYVKEPIVDIRYSNFTVTVIGEVNNPSTFTVPAGRVNVLEALGHAGDMTAYGKRENVLVIREENGVRSTTRLNLNSKEVFNSPFFFLQQNDIVYVEPDKAKAAQVSLSRNNAQFALSIGLGLASLFTLLFTNVLK